MNSVSNYPHIVCHPNICGGEPIIEGTRTTVRTIAGYYKMGETVEDLQYILPHLSLAEIHAGLLYYFDNREEIEKYIAQNHDYQHWQQDLNDSKASGNTWKSADELEVIIG